MKTFRKIAGTAFLAAVSLLFLFPLLWLADASFRPQIEIFQVPPMYFQVSPAEAFSSYSFDSLYKAFFKWNALGSFLNSSYVTLTGIVLSAVVCAMCAFALSFLRFPGRDVLFVGILATMMLPMTTMIVPYYRIISTLGLVNNPLGLILPYASSVFCVFLLRQYFIKIPFAFLEAARMEGAGNGRILFGIIFPMAKPALAALAIIQFRVIWNDFLYPMLILRSDSLFTLPIRIQLMDSQTFQKPYDAMIATGFIAVLIPVIAFLVFQKQFIEGMAGGIKQ